MGESTNQQEQPQGVVRDEAGAITGGEVTMDANGQVVPAKPDDQTQLGEGAPAATGSGTPGAVDEGSDLSDYEEVSNGVPRRLTNKEVQERLANYPGLTQKLGHMGNDIGVYKQMLAALNSGAINPATGAPRGQVTPAATPAQPAVAPSFEITNEDLLDPQKLQEKINSALSVVSQQATATASQIAENSRFEAQATALISSHPILKGMNPEVAKATFNAAVQAANATNSAMGYEIITTHAQALDNYFAAVTGQQYVPAATGQPGLPIQAAGQGGLNVQPAQAAATMIRQIRRGGAELPVAPAGIQTTQGVSSDAETYMATQDRSQRLKLLRDIEADPARNARFREGLSKLRK